MKADLDLESVDELIRQLRRRDSGSLEAQQTVEQLLGMVWPIIQCNVRRRLAREYDVRRAQKWTASLQGEMLDRLRRGLLPPSSERSQEGQISCARDLFKRIVGGVGFAFDELRRREQRAREHLARAMEMKEQAAWMLKDIDLSERLVRLERLDILSKAVDLLPSESAEIVQLRYYCGLSTKDAAALLGITVDALKNRQRKAVKILRRLLAGRSEDLSIE